MQRFAAQLRHRELTQELYDIGDELASYMENLVEAIRDWDRELVEDCLAEFDDIAHEARCDARQTLGELIGLRTALTSGIRAGSLSVRTAAHPNSATTVAGDAELAPVTTLSLNTAYPLADAPVTVSELSGALSKRTEAVVEYLQWLVEWILQRTDEVANDLHAHSYPHTINRLQARVHAAITAWLETVATEHPAYCRARRGHNPPAFLTERARIDAVVAKVAAKLKRDAETAAG
ncbi:hypothetical protein [Corynebacterium caspium]|uniref:hypothetical protein n=1 Tax=Corynebacterium caspium TaxID=234828 RepID=UPI000361416D|nr:hypothetical protein [Corynebacterium caspium]WKD58889.1 hypothetical protein CCASP_02405 [Corynebacterium caspium DSM 44850]